MQTIVTKQRMVGEAGKDERKNRLKKGAKETFGDDGYDYYFDFGDG